MAHKPCNQLESSKRHMQVRQLNGVHLKKDAHTWYSNHGKWAKRRQKQLSEIAPLLHTPQMTSTKSRPENWSRNTCKNSVMRPNEVNFAHNKWNYTNSHFYDVLSNKLHSLPCFVQSQIKNARRIISKLTMCFGKHHKCKKKKNTVKMVNKVETTFGRW